MITEGGGIAVAACCVISPYIDSPNCSCRAFMIAMRKLVVQLRHLECAQSVPANHTSQHMSAQSA